MEGDVKKTKQVIQIPKYIIPEGLDGSELIPVELGGRLVPPSVTINELGKQLLKASIDGNVDEIKFLMCKGAPFTADWLGTSPLHFAAQNNHLEVCEILLRAGISKDARTKVDRTPLHIAVYEGNIEIVKCLLCNKADLECKDLLWMTPLHWAAQKGHLELAELLVRHGAQTDVVNKFDLTPLDIALQCERHDIAEIISMTVHDPEVAANNLAVEMNEMCSSNDSMVYTSEPLQIESNSNSIPIETVLLEDADSENSVEPDRPQEKQELTVAPVIQTYSEDHLVEEVPEQENNQQKFCDSIKLLQEHGITMLPADDDNNILSSILESGHSVVLTDIGKQVLNSTKPFQPMTTTTPVNNSIKKITPKLRTIPVAIKSKKVITVTPQEFLAITKPTVRRIVMKKNKLGPITTTTTSTTVPKSPGDEGLSDIEILMRQLIDARNLVEEYKQKFLKKKAEAERYKQQLLLITQSKNNYC